MGINKKIWYGIGTVGINKNICPNASNHLNKKMGINKKIWYGIGTFAQK